MLGGALVIGIFVLLTGVALERAFEGAARAALEERLRGQLFLLMGEGEVTPDGRFELPGPSAIERLNQPDSGLYAAVYEQGEALWVSPSVLAAEPPLRARLATGEWRFTEQWADGQRWLVLGFGVEWQLESGARALSFSIAEHGELLAAQIQPYRRVLWRWLGGMAVLLLATQLLVLRWGLRPLRRVARDVGEIEAGRRESLGGGYPRELRPLTGNLDALLRHERMQQQRHRDALADLAHSLKTPLAVLQGSRDEPEAVEEQVARMRRSIDYQLQRAATAGRSAFHTPLSLEEALRGLCAALEKVYAERALTLELALPPGARVLADAGDMTELFGNLLDNACKWARARVRLSGRAEGGWLMLRLDDDGPGFGAGESERLRRRGVRGDERVPGQGIGLAVADQIVRAYGAELRIGASDWGGARLSFRLPRAAGP
ncbi:hypothetical protein F3N43_07695 [Alkalilimnicola sp. S0819]|nr:hypothetical protein F3N43_07695 [Alkalilimnicola sp. S0819]MPQ16518.1 hypothetical protein [Alkalilimnicola sp. S0819]